MSVVAADLRSPTGELRDALFPGETSGQIDTRLTAYIAEGETKAAAITDTADHDAAVTTWAYYRAYYDVWLRLLNAPASVTMTDQGAASYLASQIDAFRELWQRKLAAFEDALPDAPLSAGEIPATSATVLSYEW